MEKIFLLYTDKEQSKLLALAYTKEDAIEESQYYTDGVWFQYDYENDKFLSNEKKIKGISFPTEAKERKALTYSKDIKII